MKFGFLTVPFNTSSLNEVSEWAVSESFEALEIACWPRQNDMVERRYAGTSHIDIENITSNEASEISKYLEEMGLEISGLGFYPNPLHPDPIHRQKITQNIKNLIKCASWMGVPIVNTFCGGDSNLTVDGNWENAKKIWPELIAYSQDLGVQIAFENCPMIFSENEWPAGHNIAYSPHIWRRIIDNWDGGVRINLDPSHLIWQMIDQTKFIREFGNYICHVHAKDLKIDLDGLYEYGIMSTGIGWQIPKIPGLGDVNWSTFFSELTKVGFSGPVILEHEDRDYEGSLKLIKEGLILARQNLYKYID